MREWVPAFLSLKMKQNWQKIAHAVFMWSLWPSYVPFPVRLAVYKWGPA